MSANPEYSLDSYNVVWTTPSRDSSGSMPLGNGDIGLNVWVEPNGDLLFTIAKTDAWSEVARLLKLGRIRVSLSPSPFAEPAPFRQVLKLREGEIAITGGEGAAQSTLRVWVDANHPVIRLEATTPQPSTLRAVLEVWRTAEREITGSEQHSAFGSINAPFPVLESGDTVLPEQPNRVVWYHRNPSSTFPLTLELQGLAEWGKGQPDPLLNRTFGALMQGEGLVNDGDAALQSPQPRTMHRLAITPLTAQTPLIAAWQHQLEAQAARLENLDLPKAQAEHRAWWDEFWNRSRIHVAQASCPATEVPAVATAPVETPAQIVTRGYVLQRFINACAGRGEFPIKFNGSLFTVESRETKYPYDADFRLWGGMYWAQNTRLAYWPMLKAGDFEMMRPLFEMYHRALPLALERTRLFFQHGGAFFPETMELWGTYGNANYGWDRTGKPLSHVDNTYIRYHYAGALEIAAMMLEYFAYTGDNNFLQTVALPFTDEVVRFYFEHYKRDAAGKLLLNPAQSLETYYDVTNPTPDIAGLRDLLSTLLELPTEATTEEARVRWQQWQSALPALPLGGADGAAVILPARETSREPQNVENPELYAVFPFRHYGVGRGNLEIGRRTFAARRNKDSRGWFQDDIQAAYLGLSGEAKRLLVSRFSSKDPRSRFPAFWGPNFDWVPDQDHGNVGLIALQAMLMQADGKKITLFPAWPSDWDVDFKLHAPHSTVVEGSYCKGEIGAIKVTPAARKADLVVMQPQST